MTASELTVLMSAGMASVAGSILVAYTKLNVPLEELLGACVLVAPISYLISKISHPEIHVSRATKEIVKTYRLCDDDSSIIKSILSGSVASLKICGSIIATLIVSTSILHLIDQFVGWFFNLVIAKNLTFSVLLGYVFYPFMWLIGIDRQDCVVAGQLFGTKTVMNEFLAFIDLGKIKKHKDSMIAGGTFYGYVCNRSTYRGDQPMIFDERSFKIMVYALCGFANIASLGLLCSVLIALAPKRANTIQKNAIRSLGCAVFANLVNAAFAGLLLPGSMYNATMSVQEYCDLLSRKQ
ncbi:hypothetical protein ACOME3_005234 [Neoechinorhynchus agilis]